MVMQLPTRRVFPCLVAAGCAVVALLLAGSAVRAADEVQITVVAYVDVAPTTEPGCPGCDGEFTAEDQDYAQQHALPPLTYVVRDEAGTVLGRATTTELTVGIQRTLFTLPAGAAYVVELTAVPGDWQICTRETAARRLAPQDFVFGTARAEYHFTRGCARAPANAPSSSVSAAAVATSTVPPVLPAPAAAGVTAGAAGRAAASTATGTIKGFACVDVNGNGKVDRDDPGLAGVRVRLTGPGGPAELVSPPDGSFGFERLPPGTYQVAVAPKAAWHVTTPEHYTVALVAGQVALGSDFCIARAGDTTRSAAPAATLRDVKLPDTGDGGLPAAWLLSVAGLVLAALGALGGVAERRRHGRL
jgi:hypothetical protein